VSDEAGGGTVARGMYHLFLGNTTSALLFAVSAILRGRLLVIGLRSWKLALAMGLLVTLLNDLTYAPMGNLLFNQGRDLLSWYSNQLGLAGWDYRFIADFGLFRVPAWSWLMGLSIYVRIALVVLLLWSWRRPSSSDIASHLNLSSGSS